MGQSTLYFPIDDETCFNSTLVQLKGPALNSIRKRSGCFNSTLVQLKGEYLDFYFVPLRCFNSTLVQLKG